MEKEQFSSSGETDAFRVSNDRPPKIAETENTPEQTVSEFRNKIGLKYFTLAFKS